MTREREREIERERERERESERERDRAASCDAISARVQPRNLRDSGVHDGRYVWR